ncbi:PRC-barrel domain-containing protein [Humitalea sp. 24SJ18S-53]|uniref:PRC-barrel domain-containing protein n=1 Tax=Humitalea sp. 24SJ18S-53 TaxID=3422307 RepID=UPI003D66419E
MSSTTNPTTATHGHLIAATKVSGSTVYNLKDEKIGRIEDTMIDKGTGSVAFAVLSFGGFMGLGGKFYPLPWLSLRYNTMLDGYVVAIDKETLVNAPSYDDASAVDWSDEAFGRRVSDHWKAVPTHAI